MRGQSIMQEVLCSVIVPTYNNSATIASCIASIVEDAFDGIECIVVNDGSTDDTAERVVELQSTYPGTIRLFNNSNCGVSSARNFGLQVSRGRWILFVDADDLMIRGWQTAIFDALTSAEDSDIVLFADGLGAETPASIECLKGCLFPFRNKWGVVFRAPFSKAYSRKFLDRARLTFVPSLRIGEDALFNARAYLSDPHIACYPESIYLYRKNLCSSSNAKSESQLENELLYRRSLDEILASSSIPEDTKKAILEMNCLGGLVNLLGNSTNAMSAFRELTESPDWRHYEAALHNYSNSKRYFPLRHRIVLRLLKAKALPLACFTSALLDMGKALVYRHDTSTIERI